MHDPIAYDSSSTGWIAGQVRRASRNSLIWNGVTLLVVVLIAWFSSNYYYNFFSGPTPFDDARLLKAGENPGLGGLLAYIELKDRPLLETGWEEISTSDGTPYSVVPYFMTPVGDKMMIVMAKEAADGKHLVGPLYQVRKREAGVIAWMEERHPELRGKFLPVQLNGVAAFTVIGWIGLIAGVPVFLLCLYNFSRAAWSMQNPSRHRIVRQLSKFGDPQDVSASIDREMAAGSVTKDGKSHLTSLWLLRPTTFGMIAVQLSDIVWMYHLKQTESFAVLCLRSGKTIAMPLRGEQVDRLLAEVSARVPWALYGYDVDWLKLWRKQPADIVALSDQQLSQQLAGR